MTDLRKKIQMEIMMSIVLYVAKKGNAEAQMLLADLYISAFETPLKKKGLFWLKKAAVQNYLPAIQMLRDIERE